MRGFTGSIILDVFAHDLGVLHCRARCSRVKLLTQRKKTCTRRGTLTLVFACPAWNVAELTKCWMECCLSQRQQGVWHSAKAKVPGKADLRRQCRKLDLMRCEGMPAIVCVNKQT